MGIQDPESRVENSPDSPALLWMRGIRKSFGGVEVLHGVDFSLRAGSVVALMGENGAGKSTLMKILGGDHARDGGEVLIGGRAAHFGSPRDAEAAGVRVIYQELHAAPDLSVAENVLLGHLPRRGPLGVVDWAEASRRAAQVLEVLKADLDPRERVGRLSVGQQQLVEIARALSGQARILVMDEPTAALASREVRLLFEAIRSLRASGVGIVYISHRLDEVEEIAQSVAVLRDGHLVAQRPMAELSRGDIVRLMVGRAVEPHARSRAREPGAPVLEVESLSRPGRFEGVSFGVRAGEVVGLYGLLGAGQFEVARALFGAPPAAAGRVKIAGRPARLGSPVEAKRAGVGFVSEDRKAEGLVLGMPVAPNISLGNWPSVARGGVLQRRREAQRAEHWAQVLGIRARGGAAQEVGTLSGGNQQKVVLARWLEARSRVLILCEPTRGVDVGARADIYAALEKGREQGLALVLVSTDMEEVLALCDRVLVFGRGRVVAEVAREHASQHALLSAAAGPETAST